MKYELWIIDINYEWWIIYYEYELSYMNNAYGDKIWIYEVWIINVNMNCDWWNRVMNYEYERWL